MFVCKTVFLVSVTPVLASPTVKLAAEVVAETVPATEMPEGAVRVAPFAKAVPSVTSLPSVTVPVLPKVPEPEIVLVAPVSEIL